MIEIENELLDEIKNSKPSKFKFSAIGIYFVGSFVCVVWKIIDLLIYIF